MKLIFKSLLFCALAMSMMGGAFASDRATAEEASAMVKRGVAFAKAHGKDKLLAEVLNLKGEFVDRELYISVWDTQAKVLAHGSNAKLVGKDFIDLRDADDKRFMREIVAKAAKSGSGWVDYKWVNPVSKEIQAKSAYFEKLDDMIISSGYYK